MTEVFKAINVLTSTVIAERSSTMMQGETRQAVNFADWSRSPRMEPDLHRSLPQQAPQEIRPRIGEFRRGSVLRSCGFDERICQLKELEQEEGIEEYYNTFDFMQKRIDLPGEVLLSWFIAGLKIDTQRGIRSFRPKTVREAYVFGRLYEWAHPPSRKQSATPLQAVPIRKPSSLIPAIQASSTPLDSSSLVIETSEEKQATKSPAIGKEFQSTEPEFQRGTINGESSTCQLVENLEIKAISGNLNSVETRNREDQLSIVEALAKSANRDEYQLENKEFEDSASGAHKLFDEMPRRSLEPVLEGESTVRCVVEDSSFREFSVHLSMVDMFTFDPGGRIAAAVKPIALDLSLIESHVLVHCSTKPSTVDAPNLFEELPNLKAIRCLVEVLRTEVSGGNNLEVLSIPKSFDHVGGWVKLVFDPGGQITKEMEISELNWSGNKRTDHVNMIAGHQLMFLKIVMSSNEKSARAEIDGVELRDELFVVTIDPSKGEHKAFTEVADLLLQFESFAPIVFDPGGSYPLFKCHNIQRKIRNGNSASYGDTRRVCLWGEKERNIC